MPECRKARGKRYPLRTVLTIAVAARLAGYRGVTAFAQFAALLSQEQLEMVAAVEHGTGMVLRQVEVEEKSNETPAVRELSGGLDVTGRIVTMDAMHAQHETARSLLGQGADYVVTAVKDNQETIRDDLRAIDFASVPSHETVEKGHGHVEREREILKTGERSVEVSWCLTSLGPERAGPKELLGLVRNHWTLARKSHQVQDCIAAR